MADLLYKDRKYEMSEIMIRRALEYSFYNDSPEEEIECYEILGKLNYELNN